MHSEYPDSQKNPAVEVSRGIGWKYSKIFRQLPKTTPTKSDARGKQILPSSKHFLQPCLHHDVEEQATEPEEQNHDDGHDARRCEDCRICRRASQSDRSAQPRLSHLRLIIQFQPRMADKDCIEVSHAHPDPSDSVVYLCCECVVRREGRNQSDSFRSSNCRQSTSCSASDAADDQAVVGSHRSHV